MVEPSGDLDDDNDASLQGASQPSTPTMQQEPGMNTTSQQQEATPPATPPATRLMITKMVLENFKSYGGVREIGPFHKSFSAVVGPNGSGKSNVIDALLFVFGKRAKKLRLNKVSQLIHKSDSAAAAAAFAKVSVYMQEIRDTPTANGSDGQQDVCDLIDGTETVLTRIARQDNSSTYQWNGKHCAFKDVAAYLSSYGIDLNNNRFLILQGEVELISMMAPKRKDPASSDDGLLEYLEDIIGSSQFVEKTDEAAAAVEALSVQRQERLNRCKAAQTEKDSLQSAKEEAQALLTKDRDIRRKQNLLYQHYQLQLDKDGQTLTTQHDAATHTLADHRAQLGAAAARVQTLQADHQALKEAHAQIHNELVTTKEEFAAYERRDIKMREEVKHAKAQRKKLESKVQAETKKEQDALAKRHAAEESLPQLDAQLISLTEQKETEDAKLEAAYQEVQGVTHTLRAALEETTQALAPVQQERAVFQAALDTAAAQVQLLQEPTDRARTKLAAAETELASLDATQTTKQEALVAGQDELAKAKDRVVEAEQQDQVLADKETKVAKRHKQLLAQSEEAKAALESRGGTRSSAVKGILEATRKGGELATAGVLGRLGDLAAIGQDYDVAVSTACGMLDHIVVQTTAGAQKCLAFLRKHGLGRANFIPLDKMKKGAHDRVVTTPEGAPRLFELISPCNFSITPALFLAVGDTLVAPDLETATRWAYDFGKRWRVVTLDGKLIETSGTMAGGGKNVRRGGMKLTTPRQAAASNEDEEETVDCKNLESEAAKAYELLQECRQRRKQLAEEIRTLKKSIKALEVRLPKISVEIAGCDTTRQELTKLIPELRRQSELGPKDAAKVKELQTKVAKCKTDMTSCAMAAAKLETEVARLQKQILDAGGARLKKQQAACDKVLADLNATGKALNTARVAMTAMEKAAAKARDNKAAAELQLQECKTRLEEKHAEFKSLEQDAFTVMQAFEKVKEVEAEKRQELEAASKEVDELVKSQSEIKCAEIDLVGKIDALSKQLSECEGKKHHWTKEIAKLRAAAEEEDEMDLSDDEEEPAERRAASPASDDGDEEMQDAERPVSVAETDEEENQEGAEQDASKSPLPTYSAAALEQYSRDTLKEEISMLQAERNSIAKNANMGAIAEYRKKEADYLVRVTELDAVTEERNAARSEYEDLRRKRLEMFMDGFGQITLKLKEMYQMITLGGDAELELVDSLDPFSEGIVFSVRPPKKSWKNISNLSGGEKTLSSLALVFALHHFRPTPLYVMDEIDAALDFKNVSIVANYVKNRTKNAQFIIISLRNNMFELADRLVGIYKTDNVTKSVTINPKAFGVAGTQNGYLPETPALRERHANKELSQSAAKEVQRRVSFPSAAASPEPMVVS